MELWETDMDVVSTNSTLLGSNRDKEDVGASELSLKATSND